jgi:hypothetical protein
MLILRAANCNAQITGKSHPQDMIWDPRSRWGGRRLHRTPAHSPRGELQGSGRLGARVASYDMPSCWYQLGVARGLCCAAVGLGLACYLISGRMDTSGTRMNTRLGPNLLRVFSFVTRWSCSGNGSRAKRVRVRVFWLTGFRLGFYAQS